MTMRRNLMRATAAAALAMALAPAHAQDVIKIGEINSYKAQPAFLEPYKKGMELAVDEINAAGGLLGKKVQLVIRDDNGNPGDAVRAAEELVSREKVDVLTGSFLSHIGLALTDFAKQKKFFFLAAEPLTDKIVWQNGNRYTYRLRPSTYMQVSMLVPDAAALKKKRFFCCAKSVSASPTCDRKLPMSTSTFSRAISSSAARTASAGVPLSSRVTSTSCLPPMPPAALTWATAKSMPFL